MSRGPTDTKICQKMKNESRKFVNILPYFFFVNKAYVARPLHGRWTK